MVTGTLNTYLVFNGDCANAMRFYERIFGGTLSMRTHAESMPADQIAPGMANRIIHARLDFDGNVLMASDEMASAPRGEMSGFALSFQCPSAEGSRHIFGKLAEGGRITMPIDKTFWSEAFGMVTDRFGVPWMVNTIAQAA